jgi:uncharacterized protein DUF955
MAEGERNTPNRPTFAALLESAVTQPGIIARAYSAFHGFSLGNQLLAAQQCGERGLPLGPLASYQTWKGKGRHVKRGERALWLWMPLTIRRPITREDGSEDTETYTRFALKPHWFVYAQTEGREIPPPVIPDWDRARALGALDVTEIPFDLPDGNTLGFARGRSIAINPVNPMPSKTTFHELGHVLLGHTGEAVNDGAALPRNLREVEAECVALLCTESLGLDGAEFCRGYVQHWLRGERIPETSASRVFKAADQILRAGRPAMAEAA